MRSQEMDDSVEVPRFDNLPLELMAELLKASVNSGDEPDNQALAETSEALWRFGQEAQYLPKQPGSNSNTLRDLLTGITGIMEFVGDKPVIDKSRIVARLRDEVLNNSEAQRLVNEFMRHEYGHIINTDKLIEIVNLELQEGRRANNLIP